jgi:hypothetical protein
MPPCEFDGCVFHEELSFPMARRLVKINGGDLGSDDGRGRKIGCFGLTRKAGGRSEGGAEGEGGSVLLRFSRGKVTAHVWPGLPEEVDPGIHPLEAIARKWDLHFTACRDRDLERYREAKDLARADLEFEPPKKWERRAPFRMRN